MVEINQQESTDSNQQKSIDSFDKFYKINILLEIIKRVPDISDIVEEEKDISFKFRNEPYKLHEYFYESGHRYGDGGEKKSDISLIKEGEGTVLISHRYLAYETYSDDSTDFNTRDISRTSLFEEDELARLVFEELKRIKDNQK